jgi:hypothetical protein
MHSFGLLELHFKMWPFSKLSCISHVPVRTIVYVHVRDEGDQQMFKKDILEGRFKPYIENTLQG